MLGNSDVFSNVAQEYDRFRPRPPVVLPDVLSQLAQESAPFVVDLGSGTGLSALVWESKARGVVGIEPNDDMLDVARQRVKARGLGQLVSFQQGLGAETALADGCADIVTCAQSFHWMEPESTLAEIGRILRPGGVFAVYDYGWPPTFHVGAEMAYEAFMARVSVLMDARGLTQPLQMWPKSRHTQRMRESGHFGYVKEFLLHRQEQGDAERFVGLTLSNGVIQSLQRGLLTEKEIGLDEFQNQVNAALGDKTLLWYFSYEVRVGIKELSV